MLSSLSCSFLLQSNCVVITAKAQLLSWLYFTGSRAPLESKSRIASLMWIPVQVLVGVLFLHLTLMNRWPILYVGNLTSPTATRPKFTISVHSISQSISLPWWESVVSSYSAKLELDYGFPNLKYSPMLLCAIFVWAFGVSLAIGVVIRCQEFHLMPHQVSRVSNLTRSCLPYWGYCSLSPGLRKGDPVLRAAMPFLMGSHLDQDLFA